MSMRAPRIPPLLTGHAHAPSADAFEDACARARTGRLGAGDLVWSERIDQAAVALILEPETTVETALQMLPLAMVAAAEAVGSLVPPQVAVELRWPGTILVNGAAAGHVRIARPAGAGDAPPAWLVVGIAVDLAPRPRSGEPGERPEQTSLAEEGVADATRNTLIEAFATRLLAWLDTWTHDGFRPVQDHWLFRAIGRRNTIVVEGVEGRVLGLDAAAGLRLETVGGAVRHLHLLPYVDILPARQAE